ncbi:MAG: putative bifunctional diguanylate cyclase/phosphodiesterase [Acidimicrobiia bacterium]
MTGPPTDGDASPFSAGTSTGTEPGLRMSSAVLARAVLDLPTVLVVGVDVALRAVLFNRACEDLTGRHADEVMGAGLLALVVPPDEHEAVMAAWRLACRDGGPLVSRHHWTTPDGDRRLIEWYSVRVGEGAGVVVLSTGVDITERERASLTQVEADVALTRLAFEDALTGLPNQQLALAYVAELLDIGEPVSAVMCGIDRFKRVNDSLGLAAGDAVLQQVGRRLRGAAGPRDRLARSQGDEFLVITTGDAEAVAERAVAALAEPFELDDRALTLSTSVGIATASAELRTADDLLRAAGTALHEAKVGSRGRTRRFDVGMGEDAVARLELEADLIRALDEGEIELHYQPIVRLRDFSTAGVEALLRWTRADGTSISPDRLLRVASATRLSGQLARMTIDLAVAQAAYWSKTVPELAPFRVGFNLSPLQILDRRVLEHLDARVARLDVDPRWLVLEITEDSAAVLPPDALSALQRLRAMGMHLALDDFGTGYSSLAALQSLPIDVIKIDRAFTSRLVSDDRSQALVSAVVRVADAFGALTVAEGVEYDAELQALAILGVDEAQGYLLGPPAPAPTIDLAVRRLH